MTKVMLTGSGGFVGSHVLRHILANSEWDIVCPVSFRHFGNVGRIMEAMRGIPYARNRTRFFIWDLTTPYTKQMLNDELSGIDYILNVASQSHVDRAIENPEPFIKNNVDLMINLLELAREVEPRVFMHMSTDEVFGPAPRDHKHVEWDAIVPSNPYSASKAAQEAIAISYWRTYGVPLILTNTMNIIGETQDPEKFLPMVIRKTLMDEEVTVHTSPSGQPGSRFYIHARNFADAWMYILRHVVPNSYDAGDDRPSRYNIVGEREIDNLTMVNMIRNLVASRTDEIPTSEVKLVDFHSSRPGHDLRYALDGSKLAEIGWKPPVSIEEGIKNVVDWTIDHPEWLL